MTQVQHHPGKCKQALASTNSPVVVDLETTGLTRHDHIVSAGLLIDGVAHILFTRSIHASIKNLPLPVFYDALQPLQRPDLVVVAHNAIFDLGCLRREGIVVGGEVRDTVKLLRLLDQDRGRSAKGTEQDTDGGGGKVGAVLHARWDRRAPEGASPTLNYKLKDVVGQLLGIRMRQFPGNMELAPYEIHARYLASDLLGTWKLYEFLWPQLNMVERTYYQTLVSPLIPLLVAMTDTGVQTDPDFAWQEANRLEGLMQKLSADHEKRFGVALGMDYEEMVSWLHKKLNLPVLERQHAWGQQRPALDSDTLNRLAAYTEDKNARASLQVIQDYRQATSLMVRLRSLPKYVDQKMSRVHSTFDDSQATGRVSSTYPNLQQLAKVREIAGQKFRSRNSLRATPGYELAVFDIGQADIRVLAHAVESFPTTADEYRRDLLIERRQRMPSWFDSYYWQLEQFCNPAFSGQHQERPFFNPATPADLAADFADSAGDFYSLAAGRILGRVIDKNKDKAERNRFKVIILSTINGQGPPSLAKQLECTENEAMGFLRQFDAAYPKVAAYKQLMHWQIAYTGRTTTFMGRPRTVTAHYWMVSEPRVELFVSFKGGEAYWLDVVPLEPSLRVLTTWVLKAWNAKTGKLLYDHQRGRLSTTGYKLFEPGRGQYLLPVHNLNWRNIRRVRCKDEEAMYEGFDKTARMGFNFICQGGTADVCKLMMLRSQPVCEAFGARMLIQIHDELVFEVPKEKVEPFFTAMMPVLQQPPVPGFKVPIIVEVKRGGRFGELN